MSLEHPAGVTAYTDVGDPLRLTGLDRVVTSAATTTALREMIEGFHDGRDVHSLSDAPELTAGWQRMAVVQTVKQLAASPDPDLPPVVQATGEIGVIDEAVALRNAGFVDRAAQLLRANCDTMIEVAETLLDAQAHAACSEDLRSALQCLEDAAPTPTAKSRCRALLLDMDPVEPLSTRRLDVDAFVAYQVQPHYPLNKLGSEGDRLAELIGYHGDPVPRAQVEAAALAVWGQLRTETAVTALGVSNISQRRKEEVFRLKPNFVINATINFLAALADSDADPSLAARRSDPSDLASLPTREPHHIERATLSELFAALQLDLHRGPDPEGLSLAIRRDAARESGGGR